MREWRLLSFWTAAAHKKHHRPEPAAAQTQPPGQPAQPRAAGGSRTPAADAAMDDHMARMEDDEEDRSKMSTLERALDWLGRLHPVIVHFPLAFFPAALFTAIMGRRRPAFQKPVQFLVIAGGLIALLAVLLGWLDGGLALTDTDPLLRVHRWLGTCIGLAALGLALWAWRRPEEDRQPGMLIGLAVITAALVVQGWYGGAMVHGMDHMSC